MGCRCPGPHRQTRQDTRRWDAWGGAYLLTWCLQEAALSQEPCGHREGPQPLPVTVAPAQLLTPTAPPPLWAPAPCRPSHAHGALPPLPSWGPAGGKGPPHTSLGTAWPCRGDPRWTPGPLWVGLLGTVSPQRCHPPQLALRHPLKQPAPQYTARASQNCLGCRQPAAPRAGSGFRVRRGSMGPFPGSAPKAWLSQPPRQGPALGGHQRQLHACVSWARGPQVRPHPSLPCRHGLVTAAWVPGAQGGLSTGAPAIQGAG